MDGRPELANHVRTNNWHALGKQLGLPDNELEGFKVQYHGDIAACRGKMFSLWLQTKRNASRQQLVDALRTPAVSEITMAQQYESHIHQLSKRYIEKKVSL